MGTTNFARLMNADNYYVIFENENYEYKHCSVCGTNHYDYDYDLEDLEVCTECGLEDLTTENGTYEIDDCEIEMLQENIQNSITENPLYKGYYLIEIDRSDNDRNYPTKYFSELSKSKDIANVEIGIRVEIGYTSGYYEGANLDYSFEYTIEGYDVGNTIEEALEDFRYRAENNGINKGMIAIQSRNIESYLSKLKEETATLINNAFEKNSKSYRLQGVFSNGEGVYIKN